MLINDHSIEMPMTSLPTWQEIYDTWQSKLFSFNSNEDYYENDPYWNIPIPEYRIKLLSNYLNYYIANNGVDSLYHVISPNDIEGNINGDDQICPIEYIRFGVLKESDLEDDTEFINVMENIDNFPIYIFKKGVSDGYVSLVAYVSLNISDQVNCNGYITDSTDALEKVIGVIINDVITYFENGVGWKDENGNIISNKPATGCNSGVDPAL